LGVCREEAKRQKECNKPAFHALKTRGNRNYCLSGNFTSAGTNFDTSPPFL
jgi:hypothetical protein